MSPLLDGIAVVAGQEFRLRIRAGRWKALLALWCAVLVLLTVGLRVAAGSVVGLEDHGTIVYGGLVLLVLGLAQLVVPSLAAQSVNGDRERGTLAALQVTRLSAWEITLGKLVAAWGTALLFVALSLPMSLYAVTQGGVTLARLLAVYAVLALLTGVVCALSLWLSATLVRTTTSGLLSYVVVAVLSVGTLVVFGLVTAATQEHYTDTVTYDSCDEPSPDGAGTLPCGTVTQDLPATRARTDRVWWLLAPNPFVVLADAAPALPPDPLHLSAPELRAREQRRSLDPLGQLGSATRRLRLPPGALVDGTVVYRGSYVPLSPTVAGAPYASTLTLRGQQRRLVWPYGLAFDVALGAVALVLTERRLRTPSRTLPRGQRVA